MTAAASQPDVSTRAGRAELLAGYRAELPALLADLRRASRMSFVSLGLYCGAALLAYIAAALWFRDMWFFAALLGLHFVAISASRIAQMRRMATAPAAALLLRFRLAGLASRIAAGLLLAHDPVRKILQHWPGHLRRLDENGRKGELAFLAVYDEYYVTDEQVTPYWKAWWIITGGLALLLAAGAAIWFGEAYFVLLFAPLLPLMLWGRRQSDYWTMRALAEYLAGPELEAAQAASAGDCGQPEGGDGLPSLSELDRLYGYGMELNALESLMPRVLTSYPRLEGEQSGDYWASCAIGIAAAAAGVYFSAWIMTAAGLLLAATSLLAAWLLRRELDTYRSRIRAWLEREQLPLQVASGELTAQRLEERMTGLLRYFLRNEQQRRLSAKQGSLRDELAAVASNVARLESGFRVMADPGGFGCIVLPPLLILLPGLLWLDSLIADYLARVVAAPWEGTVALVLPPALLILFVAFNLDLRIRKRGLAASAFVAQLQKQVLAG